MGYDQSTIAPLASADSLKSGDRCTQASTPSNIQIGGPGDDSHDGDNPNGAPVPEGEIDLCQDRSGSNSLTFCESIAG